MKRLAIISIGLAATVAFAGCSSSSKDTSTTTTTTAASAPAATSGTDSAAPAAGITISGFAYSGTLTVKAGVTVTVTNKDSVAHTLTDKATKKFDTGNIPGNGGTGTFVAPSTPGSYPFGCTYHPNMAGTLVVTP